MLGIEDSLRYFPLEIPASPSIQSRSREISRDMLGYNVQAWLCPSVEELCSWDLGILCICNCSFYMPLKILLDVLDSSYLKISWGLNDKFKKGLFKIIKMSFIRKIWSRIYLSHKCRRLHWAMAQQRHRILAVYSNILYEILLLTYNRAKSCNALSSREPLEKMIKHITILRVCWKIIILKFISAILYMNFLIGF